MSARTFIKRSAFIFMMLGAFIFFGGTAMAASAPRIHISNNWAGYAATDDTYTGVSAEWVVPASSPTSRVISADAEWIGIGGIAKSDLIQAGTQAVIRDGKTEYTAWYELLPDTQRVAGLDVHAGDHIFASVSETSPDHWHIAITDLTTGQTFQKNVAYHSTHSSAEWIVERPLAIAGNATGYLPLSDFGDITFSNTMLATARGQIEDVRTSGAEQLIMSSSSTKLITAPQAAEGRSFDVLYLTSSEGARYLRTLRRSYTLQPETNASSRAPHYQEINTSYVIHVIFGSTH